LVEDSLMLSSEEKLALLEKLSGLKAEERDRLLKIMLDEKRLLDRARCRAITQRT
jgi:hypothetical protein